MAIPSSEPGKFKSAGSVGVQPDIGIGSGVFSAIAGFSKDMQKLAHKRRDEQEKLDRETEKALNRTARSKANLSNRSLGRLLSESVSGEDIKNRPELWASQLDDTVAALNEEFEANLPPGLSDEMREELMEERQFWVAEERAKLAGAALGQIEENKNVSMQAEAEGLAMTGDIDGANEIVSEMSVSDAQKTLLSKGISRISQKAKDDFAREVASGYDLNIKLSESTEELNQEETNIQADPRFFDNEPLRNSLLKKIEARSRQIRADAYRVDMENFKILDSAQAGVVSGSILSEDELRARGVDESWIATMKPIIEGVNGQSGVGSTEYNEVMSTLTDYASRQRDIADKKGAFVIDEDKKLTERVGKLLSDKTLSYDARLQLGAVYSNALFADANDNDIEFATGQMDLDDSQKEAVRKMQFEIFKKITDLKKREPRDDEVSIIRFRRSLLDPIQMNQLFKQLSDPKLIEEFKGKTKEESDKIWEKSVQPKINKAVDLSIQNDINRQIQTLKPTKDVDQIEISPRVGELDLPFSV